VISIGLGLGLGSGGNTGERGGVRGGEVNIGPIGDSARMRFELECSLTSLLVCEGESINEIQSVT
jgi:hypothetical protein